MLIPYLMKTDTHQNIGSTLFLDWCKKRFPQYKNDLFIYKHSVTLCFVLAGKTRRDGWIVDIHNFGTDYHPTFIDRIQVEGILDPRPGTEFDMERIHKAMQEKEREADRKHDEECRDLSEQAEYLKRKSHDTSGYFDWAGAKK